VILGEVDKGWNDYVKQLNDMGLEKLMKIRTDAYNRYVNVDDFS
jgi:putative aldouronate transport system substrate-binding protein